jgi:thiol-disulfide isomerase/thioredoxin
VDGVIGVARALAIAVAVAASARADAPALRPWTGGETPALAGRDLSSGHRLDLRALRGRVVLVQFWASWCEPCAAELPALARLGARHAGRPLTILTVNHGEGPERARAFLRAHGVDLPVLPDRDRTFAKAWGVGGLPMSFLVDAAGRVRSSVFGEADWAGGELAAALDELVADAERRGTDRGSARR